MNKNNLKSVIISVFFSELIALFFLVVFTFLTYNKPDPSIYSSKLGIIALLIGGLACGIISSLITNKNNMLLPLISGGTYCLLQILTTLMISDGNFDFILIVVKLILTIGVTALSSYILTNKKSSKRKHKKKIRSR